MNRNAAHEKLVDQLLVAISASNMARVWRQPTGAAFRYGALIRYGKKGSADISGILINGKRLEVEVKTGSAVQNPDQKAFGEMIENFGGLYIVARDVKKVIDIINTYICENL